MFGVFLRVGKAFGGSQTCLGSFCKRVKDLEGHENVWGLLREGNAFGGSRKCLGSFCFEISFGQFRNRGVCGRVCLCVRSHFGSNPFCSNSFGKCCPSDESSAGVSTSMTSFGSGLWEGLV